MSTIGICTIGSRAKRATTKPLPARNLYQGSHISIVAAKAAEEGLPFFILSGVHGFISADQIIPQYDYLLKRIEIAALVLTVYKQLRALELCHIRAYVKDKSLWMPYRRVLRVAADDLGIPLDVHVLSERE